MEPSTAAPAFPVEGVTLDLPPFKTAQMDRRLHMSGAQWALVETFSAFSQTQIDAARHLMHIDALQEKVAAVDEASAPAEVVATLQGPKADLEDAKAHLRHLAQVEDEARFRFAEACREAVRQIVDPRVYDNELEPLVGQHLSIDTFDAWVFAMVEHYLMQGASHGESGDPSDDTPLEQ